MLEKRFSFRSWVTLGNLSGAQILTLILELSSSALWARYIVKEIYGQYQLVISLMKMVSNFCLNGLAESLLISAAKGYDGNLAKITQYKFLATLLGSLVLLAGSFYYLNSHPAISVALWIVVFLFPFNELQQIWVHWLRGKGKIGLVAGLDVLRASLILLVFGLLIFFNKIDLNTLLSVLLGTGAVFSLGMVIYAFRNRCNQMEDRGTIHYGFHATMATLLVGATLTDKIIINHYLSIEDVAVYSIALLFPNQIKILYSIFNQIFIPKFSAAKDIRSAWQYLKPKFPIVLGIFLTIGIGGFVLMPVLIPLFFSDRYVQAVPYAQWLWLSLAVMVPATYLGNILRAQKKVKFVYLFETANPLILFFLFLILVRYGLWGMVIARAIYYVNAGIFFVSFFRYYLAKENKTR